MSKIPQVIKHVVKTATAKVTPSIISKTTGAPTTLVRHSLNSIAIQPPNRNVIGTSASSRPFSTKPPPGIPMPRVPDISVSHGSGDAPTTSSQSQPDRPWESAPVPANESWTQYFARMSSSVINTAMGLPENKTPYRHRADHRSMEDVVKNGGLAAQGGDANFLEYVKDNKPSKYIGAFTDLENAKSFKKDGRYIYNVHPGEGKQMLGSPASALMPEGEENPFDSMEHEHVFEHKIPLHTIHSHFDLDGKLHANPHYVEPSKRAPLPIADGESS